MDFQEIVSKFEELDISKNDFGYEGLNTPEIKEVLGEIKEVYHYGGEGNGDHYETVHHFVDHDVYIRLCGFYSSYDGVDYDGYEYEEVHPKEKTITVYE